LDDIQRCIGCNQGCIDRLFKGSTASCVHNPAAGYELELGIGTLRAAERAKRVVVVGAGPAGLKAAEVAARAGHDVTVLERRAHLGGQLRLAAAVDGREEIAGVITHLTTQVNKLGVSVQLRSAADIEVVRSLAPDHVIVATGSAPPGNIIGSVALGVQHTPGLDHHRVLTVWDALEDDAPVGHRVLVVDDGEGAWKATGSCPGSSPPRSLPIRSPRSHPSPKPPSRRGNAAGRSRSKTLTRSSWPDGPSP
jgi:hypothetical protein